MQGSTMGNDTMRAAREATDTAAQRTQQGISRASGAAHETVDRMAEAAGTAAERLSHKADEWMETRDQWMESTRIYVREHPMAAIGMALAAGYVLSRLMSR